MFNLYPYMNLNDLNLDYLLNAIKEMRYEVTNFVAINAIKYADPIQWDIVRQYEKNTVVIDPITGTAYISVAPVPSGVALTRPEYWTVVFDLGSFVTKAAKNFTHHYEEATTLTATFSSNVGDWLVWGDILYWALVPITAGDTYVEGSNIAHITMEYLYNQYLNTIANILAIIGDLQDLTTSDTSDIVHAINSVLNDLNLTIGDLANLTTSDTSNIVNAVNSVLNDLNAKIGDLANLTTIDKTSAVNAINEIDSDLAQEVTDRGNADTALHNEILTREIDWFNRHFLFVGDSYGDQSGEWADLIINYLQLSGRATNLCVSGASFHDVNPTYNFITQIENYSGDKSKITDIVVCGGLNDCLSNDPTAYTDVTNGMSAFNTYVKNNYPFANVSLGFIGNGDDLDPNSQIGIRTYETRQCCRYIYYNNAAVYGWKILYNSEYLLTGNVANMDSDGVHPSAAGSSALYLGLAQALRNGSADYNYPLYSVGASGLVGIIGGDLKYKIHNNVATILARTLYFTVGVGTQFTSGSSVAIASLGNIKFNAPINFNARVRLYAPDIDSTPTTNYTYVNARMTLYSNQLLMTILEGDGTTLHTYTWNAAGNYTIEDFDVDFDSMVLV